MSFISNGEGGKSVRDKINGLFQEDARVVNDVAAILLDETLTYSTGQEGSVSEGDYVRTREGFSYQVAAEDAEDHHLTTAGGVKLYVLPGADGRYNFAALGAVGDDVADDTTALQTAAGLGASIHGNPGSIYKVTDTITLASGTRLDLRGCTIKPTSALTDAAVYAYQKDDIEVFWGGMEGTGAAFSTGDENLAVFEECNRVRSHGGFFTKSRNMAILLKGCTNSTVRDPISLNCYGTGFQDRDGVGNTWFNPISDGNGDTGVATYSGGRGLLIWRGRDVTVFGGASSNCSEYGLRVYSQTGDAAGSTQIKVIGHHCEDSAVLDFYVYNESGDVAQIEMQSCTVRRTTDPSSNCIALQGDAVTWSGGSIEKVGTRLGVAAFSLYGLSSSDISGVKLKNLGVLASWSGTAQCDNVSVSGIIGDISTCGTPVGTGITYRNNKFTHGGAGTTDIAIDCGSVTSPIIDGNEFDGFWRNVSWVAQGITLRNNTSRNTTDVSLRMNGDGIAGLVSSGNDWDAGSNPSWVATAYRQKNSNSRLTAYGGAAPTTLTWARGDRIVQANPTVGLPKSWACTASGTPGTWVSEGNL